MKRVLEAAARLRSHLRARFVAEVVLLSSVRREVNALLPYLPRRPLPVGYGRFGG